MANLRANLNNDDRNRLRNDLVKSTQNAGARSVTGTRSNTRTGALTSNYVKDNTNDLARLKTFLSKYEVTRNIYYNMQMGYSGLQIKVWRLRAAKKETGTYVLLCILGFALGFCLDIALVALFDSIGIYDLVSGAFYLLVLGACIVLPIPIYSKNLNKRLKKAEQELQVIVTKYAKALKSTYESTNKAVSFSYASPYIVDKLIEYMENGRCDSIKECLNLYEQEKIQYEQMRMLHGINKHAALTSAATQYLAFDTWIKNVASLF